MLCHDARVGVELWEVGEALGVGDGGGVGVPGGRGDEHRLIAPPTTALPHENLKVVDSCSSSGSSSGGSSSCCSSSSSRPRRPCLHAALSDPGYESGHRQDCAHCDDDTISSHDCFHDHHHNNIHQHHDPNTCNQQCQQHDSATCNQPCQNHDSTTCNQQCQHVSTTCNQQCQNHDSATCNQQCQHGSTTCNKQCQHNYNNHHPPDCVSAMSLRERGSQEGRTSPSHHGLTRSRSFGGLLSGRRSVGSGSVGSGSGVMGGSTTMRPGWAGQGVLGQASPSAASPRDVRRVMSLPPHVKFPKAPRPERAVLITSSVARGLGDTTAVTRQDLATLRQAERDYHLARSQGRVYEVEKQIKAAERYLKRVEYQLCKLEDLQDQYTLSQRLREGVRTMAYAYALSPGKEKASALSNVRSGYRECTETLCSLEVQIEQLIGTLTLEMKGIQGFARLCPGDVFEVTLKHGSQKWKTRGRVGKDNTQTWDNQRMVFKGLIGEMLIIKAVEVRLLGKTLVIGNKVCETKDLFSPHAQLMTVNLNPSGSLKLNIVVTWNPLDGVVEDSLVRTPSVSATSPGGRRRPILHSFSSSPPQTVSSALSGKDGGGLSPEYDHDSSFGSMSARSSTTDSASPLSEYRGLMSSQAALSSRTDSNSPISDYQGLSRRTDSQDSILFDGRDSASPSCDNTGNFTLVRKKENRVEQWARYSQMSLSQGSNIDMMTRSFPHLPTVYSPCGLSPALSQSLSHQLDLLATEPESTSWVHGHPWDAENIPTTLPMVVSRLRTCLEDIQGQFPALHTLEEAVLDLHDLCKQCRSRRDSNTSEISLSVESALECFDFLNAECDDDFEDDNPEECAAKNHKEAVASEAAVAAAAAESAASTSPSSSTNPLPEPPTPIVTGSQHLDTFIFIHLRQALLLLQHLGSYGPLKSKERNCLQQLEREGQLVATVLSHRHNFDSLRPQHIIPVPHVQVLWDSVATGEEWCVTGLAVVNGLLPVVSSLVEPDEEALAKQVLEELVCVMSGVDNYSDSSTVTVGHFLHHLRRPLQLTVPETAVALTIYNLLTSKEVLKVESGLNRLKNPTVKHVRIISDLLSGSADVTSVVIKFIDGLSNNNQLMHQVVDLCLLQLQGADSKERSSGCMLLGRLAPLMPSVPLLKRPPRTSTSDNQINGSSSSTYKPCTVNSSCNISSKSTSNLLSNSNGPLETINETSNSSNSQFGGCSKSVPKINKSLQGIDVLTASEWPRPIEVLSFMQQTDSSIEVRESSRDILLNLGAEGKAALHNIQLSSHGFQGVEVKEKTKL